MPHLRKPKPLASPKQGSFLTGKQLRFVSEYLIDLNGTRAAVAAGYKPNNAAVQASFLLDPERNPLVVMRIEKLKAEKALRSKLTGDELLARISAGITFNPTHWFERGESRAGVPGWLMTEEQMRALPTEIGALIEEMEARTVTRDGAEVRRVWVKFVSKLGLINVAAKHLLSENLSVKHSMSPWDALADRVDAAAQVEAKVRAPLMIGAVADDPVDGGPPGREPEADS
jgi:phage terminase small subunit